MILQLFRRYISKLVDIEPDKALNNRFKQESLKLLSAALPISILISITLGALFVWVLGGQVAQVELYSWLALLIFVSLYRLLVFYNLGRQSLMINEDIDKYLSYFRLGAFGAGLIWGATTFLFANQVDAVLQIYITFLLGGVIGGGASTLAADKVSVTCFILPTIVPNIIYYFSMDELSATTMGLGWMLVLYASFMLHSARLQGKNIFVNYQLRLNAISSEQKIKHLAYHDVLTNLPNRALFNDRLSQALIAAKRNDTLLAVMFLDLDGFKMVNDSYGHDVGDALLIEVAQRIKASLRHTDTVSRMGGDEFIILLSEVASTEAALAIAEKIRVSVKRVFEVQQAKLHVSMSIGVAMYPEHSGEEITLLKAADAAMYHAKSLGKNNTQLYKISLENPAD